MTPRFAHMLRRRAIESLVQGLIGDELPWAGFSVNIHYGGCSTQYNGRIFAFYYTEMCCWCISLNRYNTRARLFF